ncbi:MAG TPA: hypothetical protein VFF69_15805 [Phycisphaerales bacterium]|nr:hypothetical protein [Phycisphaerales bacterium]
MRTLLEPRNRWRLLGIYWLAQALALLVLYVFFVGTTGTGEWDLLPPADYLQLFDDSGLVLTYVISALLLTLLQLLLILPVNLPVLTHHRGRSVKLSLAAAGAFIAAIVVGLVAAVCELVVLYELAEPREWSWGAMAIGLAISWAFFTTLLLRYANRSRLSNDDLVTRVARIVFAGTAVETAALIPIDVMIRRRTECYCWSGSFWALILSGAVGIVVAGPAIFLPLLARRPRRRPEGLCHRCAYNRSGLGPSAPCPECGTTPGSA